MVKRKPQIPSEEPAVCHAGIDLGTFDEKTASEFTIKDLDGILVENPEETHDPTVSMSSMRSAFAESKDKLGWYTQTKFYGEKAVLRLALDRTEEDRRKAKEKFGGGLIFREGRIIEEHPEYFAEVLTHTLNSIPGEKIRIAYTLPPEELLDQEQGEDSEADPTPTEKALLEVLRKCDRIDRTEEGNPCVLRIAQNIAASRLYRAEIYDAGETATIIDIGGGTTDIVVVNIEPSDPRKFEPYQWTNLSSKTGSKTGVNIAGNYRDERARRLIEEKLGFDIGIKEARNIMANYSFVDAEGYPILKKYPIMGKYGDDEEFDIFDPVREASIEIPLLIPQQIRLLAAREEFKDKDVKRGLVQNIYLTGNASRTKGLQQFLQHELRTKIKNKRIKVTVFKDPKYSAARGALDIARSYTIADEWDELFRKN